MCRLFYSVKVVCYIMTCESQSHEAQSCIGLMLECSHPFVGSGLESQPCTARELKSLPEQFPVLTYLNV